MLLDFVGQIFSCYKYWNWQVINEIYTECLKGTIRNTINRGVWFRCTLQSQSKTNTQSKSESKRRSGRTGLSTNWQLHYVTYFHSLVRFVKDYPIYKGPFSAIDSYAQKRDAPLYCSCGNRNLLLMFLYTFQRHVKNSFLCPLGSDLRCHSHILKSVGIKLIDLCKLTELPEDWSSHWEWGLLPSKGHFWKSFTTKKSVFLQLFYNPYVIRIKNIITKYATQNNSNSMFLLMVPNL